MPALSRTIPVGLNKPALVAGPPSPLKLPEGPVGPIPAKVVMICAGKEREKVSAKMQKKGFFFSSEIF